MCGGRCEWSGALLSKDEEHCAAEAEAGPEEIEFDRLLHVPNGKWYEDGERDHFLHDLKLGQIEHRVTDAVGGDLQQVFKQRDTPTQKRRDVPRFVVEFLEMRVPRERHEDVGRDQEQYSFGDDGGHILIVLVIDPGQW